MVKSKLSFHLAHTIGAQIMRGKVGIGEILPTERELGEQYGVSRTVVREAVKMLSAKGLVESRSRRGTQVRAKQNWNLFDPDLMEWTHRDGGFFDDLAELRRMVEPAAAELAARRATAKDLQALQTHCERMEAASEKGWETAFNKADRAFHETLIKAGKNVLVQHLFERIMPLIWVNFEATSHLLTFNSRPMRLHRQLVEAVQARNAEEARATMEAIIEVARINALTKGEKA